MCGVNVYFGDDPTVVQRMTKIMEHRGTRSTFRSYFDDLVHVGHRRLPIFGLEEMYDHPSVFGPIDAFLVGELLNFRSIVPKSATDTDVLSRAWLNQGGPQCLQMFEGFWAVAVIDQSTRTTFVGTDPMAKKPLYVRSGNRPGYIAGVSSEIWPLLAIDPSGPPDFDPLYFSRFLKWGYSPMGDSPFRGVTRIPPGTVFGIDPSGQVISEFTYQATAVDVPLPVALRQAVRDRLESDVPVSILLSGGLDSTIVYLLAIEFGIPLTAFHVENGEREFLDYLPYPSFVRVETLDTDGTESSIADALRANGSPVDLGSVVPQYTMAKFIRDRGFNVALSGDGADELFGGYRRAAEYDSQHSDVNDELVNYHLPRLDAIMMSGTVELRCPFLSWSVIWQASKLKHDVRRSKEFLKETFGHMIPDPILNRKKEPLRTKEHRVNNPRGVWGRNAHIFRNTVVPSVMEDIRRECR